MEKDKLKIGIYELTGCAGDALLIIDCEKELVDIFQAADIQSFLMAKSDNIDGELDVALVEGSVSTELEKKEILDIRKRAKVVVAIGICACYGGIQAAFLKENEWEKNYKEVYGKTKMTHTKPVQPQPIDAYIKVDYYLPGCPIGKEQFLSTFNRVIRGILLSSTASRCAWNANGTRTTVFSTKTSPAWGLSLPQAAGRSVSTIAFPVWAAGDRWPKPTSPLSITC